MAGTPYYRALSGFAGQPISQSDRFLDIQRGIVAKKRKSGSDHLWAHTSEAENAGLVPGGTAKRVHRHHVLPTGMVSIYRQDTNSRVAALTAAALALVGNVVITVVVVSADLV